MNDSRKLLDEYVANGSESAFRELVTRYTDLVHSTALRLVNGDSHQAQDIAQTVFLDLARKAGSLKQEVALGGWLHRHTCNVAATAIRGQRRRQFRERQAVEMNTANEPNGGALATVAPVLDEAINRLDTEDRTAILLRFYEQMEFRAVGEFIGSNEDAARMRVNRALDKLHALLKNHGGALTAAALGTALTAEAVTAAPAGMAAALATQALAGAAVGGAAAGVLKVVTITKLKLGIAAALAAIVVATPLVIQYRSLARARVENQELRQQVDQLAAVQADYDRLSNQVESLRYNSTRGENQSLELARLRGQVGMLRDKTNEMARDKESLLAQIRAANDAPVMQGGKRVFRGMTMGAFAKFIGEVLQAPVADQTGLTGVYDIAMTPPRQGTGPIVPRVTGILRDELGLELVAFSGPFKPDEQLSVRVGQSTNAGYAIRLNQSGAPGLRPATDAEDPFGLLAAEASRAAAADGSGTTTTGSDEQVSDEVKAQNACINNLRLIDAAKQQWALEFGKKATDTPEWTDIQPYLGRGSKGELPACPSSGAYTMGAVSEVPQCSIPGHKLQTSFAPQQ